MLTSDAYTGDKYHINSSSYTPSRPIDYSARHYSPSLSSSFTSDLSYGTTPYKTTADKGRTGDYLSQPFIPVSYREIRLGKRVVVMRSGGRTGRGVVRYVGSLSERPGSYVGVELDSPGRYQINE